MMKTKREKPKKSLSRRLVLAVDGVINHLLLIFAALIFLFGFYALWDSNQVYSLASSSEYEAYRPVTTQQDELASFSGFSKLQELNPEVLGWINVYGTNIDYPLVQAKDNEKYLNKDSKGEFAATGAIFLDARNNPKFEDFNTIIYGHHVENGVMFGDVAKFADQDFLTSIVTVVYTTMVWKKGSRSLRCWRLMPMTLTSMIQEYRVRTASRPI